MDDGTKASVRWNLLRDRMLFIGLPYATGDVAFAGLGDGVLSRFFGAMVFLSDNQAGPFARQYARKTTLLMNGYSKMQYSVCPWGNAEFIKMKYGNNDESDATELHH